MQPQWCTEIFNWCRIIAVSIFFAIYLSCSKAHAWIDIELNVPEMMQVRYEIDQHDKERREKEAQDYGTYRDSSDQGAQ